LAKVLLIQAINNWKKLFPIDQVCFVGDRAMMSKKNIELLQTNGYHYVIAAKLKQLPANIKHQLFDSKHYQPCLLRDDLNWVAEFKHEQHRLIVGYTHKRAKKDASDRQKVIDKLNKKLSKNNDVKQVISNQGVKQYVKVDEAAVTLDEEKLDSARQWDGLHGAVSNITDKSPQELIDLYN
jgi:transposase